MKNGKLLFVYAAITALLGVGGGVWLYMLMNKYFDVETNAFYAPTSATAPFGVFVALVLVAVTISAILKKKDDSAPSGMPKAVCFVSSALFALSAITSAAAMFADGRFTSFDALTFFALACTLSAAAAAAYFYFKAAKKAETMRYFYVSLPLWAVFEIGASYFNPAFTYTNFVRAFLALALSAAILFSLAHSREILGKKHVLFKSITAPMAAITVTAYLSARIIYVVTHGGLMISDALETSLLAFLPFIYASMLFKDEPLPVENTGEEEPPAEENGEDANQAE